MIPEQAQALIQSLPRKTLAELEDLYRMDHVRRDRRVSEHVYEMIRDHKKIATLFQKDDGGRAAAGFKGDAGDCVTRAITIATGMSYRDVYDSLAHLNYQREGTKSARNGVHKSVYKPYLESIGWKWTPTMGIGTGCKVHLRPDELPKGRLIVSVSKHLVAVVDGVIHDTYDPSRGGTRCVYGYWSTE